MVPGQGMLVFGLGLGLVTGGDRCARDAARQNRQKCLCNYVPLSVPSRSVLSLRICTQGSSNFGPGPSRPFAFVPKAVLVLVIAEEKSFWVSFSSFLLSQHFVLMKPGFLYVILLRYISLNH